MTDSVDFPLRVAQQLRATKTISKSCCEEFDRLPLATRVAYVRAMNFLGCESLSIPADGPTAIPEMQRIRASKLMLLKIGLDSDEPRWSSWVLSQLLQAVIDTPSGRVSDLFHALFEILGEHSTALNEVVANFIKVCTVKCFTEYRDSYNASEFEWMMECIMTHSTPAQAYLAMLAVPPKLMQPRHVVAILKALTKTRYWTEAVAALADDLLDNEQEIAKESDK